MLQIYNPLISWKEKETPKPSFPLTVTFLWAILNFPLTDSPFLAFCSHPRCLVEAAVISSDVPLPSKLCFRLGILIHQTVYHPFTKIWSEIARILLFQLLLHILLLFCRNCICAIINFTSRASFALFSSLAAAECRCRPSGFNRYLSAQDFILRELKLVASLGVNSDDPNRSVKVGGEVAKQGLDPGKPRTRVELIWCFCKRRSIFLAIHQPLKPNLLYKTWLNAKLSPTQFQKSGSMWIQLEHKSSGGKRPKKKIYHREYELDRFIDLQKKPSLILQLKSIIQAQKHQSLLLRDLEKEVGFVQKWNFMAIIEKYPSLFHVSGGNRTPPSVMLTQIAQNIAAEEADVKKDMEPILVNNLRKLLMMSVDCRVSLEKIEFIQSEMGLPKDFKKLLIPKYPEYFSVKNVNGKDHLQLENWDSSLAVTAREKKLECDGFFDSEGYLKNVRITKDGPEERFLHVFFH